MKPQSGFVAAGDALRALPPLPPPASASGAGRRRSSHRPDRRPSRSAPGRVSGLAFGLGPVVARPLLQATPHRSTRSRARTRSTSGASSGSGATTRSATTSLPIAGISALHFGMLLFVAGVGVRPLAGPPRDRARRARGARAHGRRGSRRPARVHVPDADARALHVPRARVLAPLVFVRPLRLAYAALSALFLLNLWYAVRVLQLVQWHVQDFHFQPWFDWLFGGFATDTWQKKVWSLAVTAIALVVAWRGVRWAGTFAPLQGALAAPCARRLLPAAAPLPACARRRPASTPEPPPPGWPHAGARSRSSALACLFGLVVLRGETTPAVNLNDSAFHLQMVRWAGGQIREGRVPLDGWYPVPLARARRSSTTTRASRTRSRPTPRASTGAGDQTHLPLDPLPAARAVADRRLLSARACSAGAAGPPRPRRPSRR